MQHISSIFFLHDQMISLEFLVWKHLNLTMGCLYALKHMVGTRNKWVVWLLCFPCFVGIVTVSGFSCKTKRMFLVHTCGVLQTVVPFVFWWKQQYGGIEFALRWIQAASCSVLHAHFFLTLFSLFPSFQKLCLSWSTILSPTVLRLVSRQVHTVPEDTDSKRHPRRLKWNFWIIFPSQFLF